MDPPLSEVGKKARHVGAVKVAREPYLPWGGQSRPHTATKALLFLGTCVTVSRGAVIMVRVVRQGWVRQYIVRCGVGARALVTPQRTVADIFFRIA